MYQTAEFSVIAKRGRIVREDLRRYCANIYRKLSLTIKLLNLTKCLTGL